MKEMKVVYRPIEEIEPYDRNPRKNDSAVANVAESIRQYGWQQPIVVDTDGVIIVGHTRYKAAKKLRLKKIPVVVADNLTPEQVREYRLIDNKTNEAAEWDMDLLPGELEGLTFDGFEGLDWGVELQNEAIKQAVENGDYDAAAESITEPRSRTGDIYQLGKHRLMCGDSTRQTDVQKLAGGVLADLLLTDPPYGVSYTGGTSDALTIQNDNLGEDALTEFLTKAFTAGLSAMKPGAAFYIWLADTKRFSFEKALRNAGMTNRQCLVWVKNQAVLGRQDYHWAHEPCLYGWAGAEEPLYGWEHETGLYGWKDGAAHNWEGDRKRTTVLCFDKPVASREHPTMKPVPLFEYLMKNSSRKGDTVLDLFAGSGTTIIAAEQNGRKALCMECDPRYVDVIIDRWELLTGKDAELIERAETDG